MEHLQTSLMQVQRLQIVYKIKNISHFTQFTRLMQKQNTLTNISKHMPVLKTVSDSKNPMTANLFCQNVVFLRNVFFNYTGIVFGK